MWRWRQKVSWGGDRGILGASMDMVFHFSLNFQTMIPMTPMVLFYLFVLSGVAEPSIASVLGAREMSGGKQATVAVAADTGCVIRFAVDANQKLGWKSFYNSPTEGLVAEFDYTTFPSEHEVNVGCSIPHLRATCQRVGCNMGTTKSAGWKHLANYQAGLTKSAKSAGGNKTSIRKDLVQEALALGIVEGVKTSGIKKMKTVPITDLNMEEISELIEQKKKELAEEAVEERSVSD